MGDTTAPIRPDVKLSTGRVITHSRMPNGAIAATVQGNPAEPMTNAEWDEYAEIVKASVPR